MSLKTLCTVVVILALTSCSNATPEQQIVNDAAQALGGKAKVQAARTLTLDGEGTNFNIGQDMVPGASTQTFALSRYRRVVDIGPERQRIEQTRTPTFAYFQGPQAQNQVFGLDGEAGYNVAPNGTPSRLAATAAQDRRVEFYHHPLLIVRAALDPAAKLANAQTVGNERQLDITTPSGITVTLVVDSAGLPTRVTSKTDQANLGDVTITTSFADYQDIGGLKLPAKLTTKTDEFTTAELRATQQTVDGDVGDLKLPEAAAATPLPAASPAVIVTVEPLGKGLWLLAGQSHHSVLVEFSDHLLLIEAPQSEARTLAVIAKARELAPGKTLTKLVTTHHHFDHTGGLRAAISEGLGVVTHSGNKAFVETMAKRPHTIRPDALAKASKAVTVETVAEEMVLKDAAMEIALYHVAGSPHSDTMLMAYIPKERILVEVDVFSPGAQVQPYAANLLENVKRRNLRVDRIVPLHGAIVPFAELAKALLPPASR